MGKGRPLIFSFNAGQLSPRMGGRVDQDIYSKGCNIMRNMFPWPQGAAQNRSGSQFIRKVDNDGSNPSRLIPFSIASQADYVVSFGTSKNEVFKDKAYLLDMTITSGVTGLYTGDQKWEFDFAQNKDTLFIASDDRTLNIIKRSSASKFILSDFKFEIPPLTPLITFSAMISAISYTFSATSGDWIKLTSGNSFLAGDVGRVMTLSDASGNKLAGKAIILAGDFDATTGIATTVMVKILETLDTVAPARAEVTGIPLAQLDPSATGPIGSVIDIETSGTFPYINELITAVGYWELSAVGTNTYYLKNTSPLYSAVKPDSVMVMGVEMPEGATGALEEGEWDFTNEDALGYNTIYVRLALNAGVTDPDDFNPLAYELAAKRTSAVVPPAFRTIQSSTQLGDNHFIGGFIVIQSGLAKITAIQSNSKLRAEVIIELSSHDATFSYITYQTAFETVLPFVGTTATNAYPKTVTFHEDRLVLGGSDAFPQTIWMSDTGLYDSFTPSTSDSASIELTLLSKKINVVRWMESRDILIIGTDNGEFAVGKRDSALTPSNLFARKQTSIGSDNEAKPVIAEKSILFVEKNAKKIRELTFAFESDDYKASDLTLLSEQITGTGIKDTDFQQRPIPVLWCTTDDGKLIGMTYILEQQIVAWHEHKTGGTAAGVYDNSDSFESVAVIPGTNQDEVWVSVKRTIDGNVLYYIEVFTDVYDSETGSDGRFLDSYVVDTTKTTTVSGLTHLIGDVVTYIVDGDPAKVGTATVQAGGTITIAWTPTVNAVAGLPYTSTLQTMRTNAAVGDMGTIQGTLKRIHEVWLRLYRTLAGKAGPTESRLADLTGTTTIKDGDIKVVDFQGRWDTDGYITIVQEKPSPITVIAIAATVEATENR